MRLKIVSTLFLCLVLFAGCGTTPAHEPPEPEPTTDIGHDNVMIDLWEANAIAFGTVASAGDIEQRVAEGFSALLMSGDHAHSTIELGRTAAGRQ